LHVEYTYHARYRIRIRNISENEVLHVLKSPHALYYDISTNSMVAIGPRTRKRAHWLIIVFVKEDNVCRVITVIDTKSIDKIVEKRTKSGRWVPVW